MKIVVKEHNPSEFVMIVACVTSVCKNLIDSSSIFKELPLVSNLLLLLFFACIGYKLLNQKYHLMGLVLLIAVGGICAYSCFAIKYLSLLYSYLFLIALQDVDLNKILKASIITKLVLLSIHIFSYIANAIFQAEAITFFYRNGIERMDFFLGHPNTFTAYLTWTCLEMIYVFYKQINNWKLLIIWLVNIVFYRFTNSNTGTIVISLVIILVYLEKKQWMKVNLYLELISRYGFLVSSVLFAYLAIIYKYLNGSLKVLWNQLNEILTGRLLYGAYTSDMYGFTFIGRLNQFPRKSFWYGQWLDFIFFDNSYFQFYFEIGFFYLIIISIAFIAIGRRTSYIEKILICALIYYGIMERYIVNVFICFPFMLIGKYIYKQKLPTVEQKDMMEGALWRRS